MNKYELGRPKDRKTERLEDRKTERKRDKIWEKNNKQDSNGFQTHFNGLRWTMKDKLWQIDNIERHKDKKTKRQWTGLRRLVN